MMRMRMVDGWVGGGRWSVVGGGCRWSVVRGVVGVVVGGGWGGGGVVVVHAGASWC